MLREMSWKLILISILMSLTACTYYVEKDQQKNYKTDAPYTVTFYGSYDEVWKAVGRAVVHYRSQLFDKESGYFESMKLPLDQGWRSPDKKKAGPSGRKYKIKVRVVRAQVNGRKAINVLVKKQITMQRDFFSEVNEIASDGLEELSVLYRIKREYRINKGIDKYFQEQNQ